MEKIISKSSAKLRNGIIFCYVIGIVLFALRFIQLDAAPLWVCFIFWGIGSLALFGLKTTTYEKHAITTIYWLTSRQIKLDTLNISSLQLKLTEKTRSTKIGLLKRLRIIEIKDESSPIHYVEEVYQDNFDGILTLLKDGFAEKWLEDDLDKGILNL